MASDFAQHLVFEMLNLSIKFTHNIVLPAASKVTKLDVFAHLSETGGKFIYKPHFYTEIYWQIRILMSGIDGFAYIEIYIGRFFKQQTRDL
jgi:hypothetical protein